MARNKMKSRRKSIMPELLSSPGFVLREQIRVAFACGGQPAGLMLLSFAPTGSYHTISSSKKGRSLRRTLLPGGISRTRTYDPHDVNVVL